MEKAFGLRSRDVTGRPVVDVLAELDTVEALARRLSLGMSSATGDAADGKLDVQVNGRDYLAGISTAHYVRKEKIVESAVTGTPVVALCGKVWVPGRNPDRFPVCPMCKEIYDGLRRPEDGDGDGEG